MVYYLDMARLLDNLQMTFINRSVVISRAVTILRSNETYLCIEGLLMLSYNAACGKRQCDADILQCIEARSRSLSIERVAVVAEQQSA